MVESIVIKDKKYYLGHTYSFPVNQTGINDAVLLRWVKEINVADAVGKKPNTLLFEAMQRKSLKIVPNALINDTVGTFLVAAWHDYHTNVASIIGTGHNTCYLQKNHPLTGRAMIINLEAANFDINLPYTKYDNALDKESQAPGKARLEKMVAGVYLGELLRLMIVDLTKEQVLFRKAGNIGVIKDPYKLEAQEISKFILGFDYTKDFFSCTNFDVNSIQKLCVAIVKRAARLIAGTYIGTILHIDPNLDENQSIAIDGSIFEKMPHFKEELSKGIEKVLLNDRGKIELKLVNGGSGTGAAIAAAMVSQ